MTTAAPLATETLRRRCDPDRLAFETTETLDDLDVVVGQDRAGEAVKFGIGIRHQGYNVFALGRAGTGRHSVIRRYLEQTASNQPVPDDWCYIHNFADPHQPLALHLPAGRGVALRRDMEQLVEELQAAIPAVFEGEDYRASRQALETEFKEHHEDRFAELQQRAEKKNIVLIRTPMGLTLAPTKDGEVLGQEEFDKLPEDQRKTIEQDIETLQADLQELLREVPRWEREQREKLRALNREFTTFAVNHQLEELRERYADLPDVVEYLKQVETDVLDNAQDFLRAARQHAGAQPMGMPVPAEEPPSFRRYQVNVIVDNAETEGAPIVYEDHPTYQNLIGQVEHLSQFGTLVTDFGLIRAGALHRANGGYLILDAHRVLMQPFAWEGLKRALGAREIRIESIGQMMSLISTISLEPETIPLDVKVVLVGERQLYYLLSTYDPDFAELFKVPADFDDRMDRDDEEAMQLARLIASVARHNELKPLDRAAVARVIEQGSRWAEDSEKISTHMRTLADLLREADYHADGAERAVITAADVEASIAAQIHRSDRIYEMVREEIRRGSILVDIEGEKVGQINGLAVYRLADYSFGRPMRITARVRLGRGQVVDIEREVELGGPIHSKGVLILGGYLGGHYALDKPLALLATLVFEQSYSGTEGDSASTAELLALLSALSRVPLKQSLAITGSVNQLGQVQPIGGVNQKIEGHFDVCSAIGLNGEQGVVIPQSNVKHLMLREDVVAACAEGKFRVYAVSTVDEALELMTGRPAGERDADGHFPEGSVNRAVEDRLAELADLARAFALSSRRGEDDK